MTAGAARTEGRPVLHLIGNSHIDPVWLWQWPEGYQEIRATFRSALDRMREYPEFIFTCDSVAYYEWIAEIDPEMFEEIRERVAEGRWEVVGGWWVEPDCNLPGGESFVRQALIGQRFFQEHFGRIATVGYNVDPFGHHAMLPQLLSKSGMDSYVFMRPGPHELGLPGPLFWWESADGSRVLGYRLPHEYCAPREDLGNHLDKSIAQLPDRWAEMMAFYGVGNHGGGPTRENLDSIRRLDGAGAMPRLRHSTPAAFFASVRASGADLPVWRDDLQHHAVGCYSAHSGIKRWMRRAESELATAEAWAAVADVETGRSYPRPELARAWRQVLFNQFHDTLGGTAIEPAYRDARDQLGEASSIASRALNLAVQSIAAHIDIPSDAGTKPIVVFNPHAWPVRAAVELEYGGLRPDDGLVNDEDRPVPFQSIQSYATVSAWRSRFVFEADLPPLGYRLYRVRPGAARPEATPLRAFDTTLENEHVRLTIDPDTGRIASLVVRSPGPGRAAGAAGADAGGASPAATAPDLDVVDRGRSRAVVVDDTSDTWSHRKLAFLDEIDAFRATSVELIETGPVRGIVRVNSEYGSSRLTEDYVLAAGATSVEVRVILDWREHAKLLKLRYATRVDEPAATYEIPYGVISRPANGEEEPGQRWVDVSGTIAAGQPGDGGVAGLAVLNDAKYGFDVARDEIGVTAVRSPIYAHHEPAVPREGVRYQFQDQGQQRFTLALLPHLGDWTSVALTRRAAELNQRPTVLFESFHPGSLPAKRSFLSVEPEHVIVGAMKLAEDGDEAVVRVAETVGRAGDATVRLPAWDREIGPFEIGPFEIRTFRVPRDPSAAAIETDLLERPTDHG
ncbi:MAG TPA: glycoside hydrolase family 38 C-terminal domain-containing protein [Candidatus Limnocylindrales bacterium]